MIVGDDIAIGRDHKARPQRFGPAGFLLPRRRTFAVAIHEFIKEILERRSFRHHRPVFGIGRNHRRRGDIHHRRADVFCQFGKTFRRAERKLWRTLQKLWRALCKDARGLHHKKCRANHKGRHHPRWSRGACGKGDCLRNLSCLHHEFLSLLGSFWLSHHWFCPCDAVVLKI